MNYSKKSLWIFALIFISIISCSKDDDTSSNDMEPMVDPTARFLTAQVDGEQYFSETFQLTGTLSENNPGYAFGVVGAEVSLLGTSEAITIGFVGLDINTAVGTLFEIDNAISGTAFAGMFTRAGTSESVSANAETEGQGMITSIDTIAKTFSGTFSFVAIDEDSNTSYSITNGVFQNVEYD